MILPSFSFIYPTPLLYDRTYTSPVAYPKLLGVFFFGFGARLYLFVSEMKRR